MHSLFESYLADVARRLGPLPSARRDEELQEMRQHLLSSLSVNRTSGQTLEEAAACAIEQLGTPQELAGSLVWSWRRERERDSRRFCGAVVAVPLLLWGMTLLINYYFSSLLSVLWPSCNVFFSHHLRLCHEAVDGVLAMRYVLTGAILGATVPKQAVKGMALGAAVYECGYLIWLSSPDTFSLGFLSGLSDDLVWGLVGVSFAWAVSRLRSRTKPLFS